MTMRSEILFLYLTLQHWVEAEFPYDQEPAVLWFNEQAKDYLLFLGHESRDDTEQYKLNIQQTVAMDRILYIADRDNVYTVDMDTSHIGEIYYSKKLTWESSAAKVADCNIFGKTEDECHNFIKVLIKRNDSTLFICGTDAFSPSCRNYKMDTLEAEGEEISGTGRCPFDAKESNVALFSEPNFIHIVDYDNYMYFFFREEADEYKNVGQLVVSRVARICKNDMGGNNAFLDRQWTSFLKARLNCLVPSVLNFYFDILQAVTDVVHINGHDVVFATFTTSEHSIPGSAVCAFDMLDLDKVFSGKFKGQGTPLSIWTTVSDDKMPTPRPSSCAGSEPLEGYASSRDFPDTILKFMKDYHLMDEDISSTFSAPWFLQTMVRYRLTQIAVDVAAGPNADRVVVFIGSERGAVLKVMDTSGENAFLSNSFFLEEIHVYNRDQCHYKGSDDPRIVSMQLDKPSGSLYVAFPHCLIKVPLGRCERHGKCKKACIASQDPYCGWMTESKKCKYLVPGDSQGFEQDIEHGDVKHLDNCLKKSATILGIVFFAVLLFLPLL